MITLLVHNGPTTDDAPGNRTGGVPLTPAGFTWPACLECDRPLQFDAQFLLDDDTRLLAVFQCVYDPGMCDDWDADAGGNRAYLFDNRDLVPVTAPGSRMEATGVVVTTAHEQDYDTAVAAWGERTGRSTRDILGGIGGPPSWIQGDETPSCVDCARPMVFAAHLEEGTTMNFGVGLGYAFRCADHPRAKFLWQR